MIEASTRLDLEPSPAGWGWAFIDQAARGRNGWRPYTAALLRIVFYPLIFAAVVIVTFGMGGHVPPVAMAVALFGSMVAAGAAVIQSVVRSHRRPWRSLISPNLKIDWRRLAIGATIQAALLLPLFFIPAFGAERPRNLPPGSLWVVVISVLLIPLQAASEEILFRGYLTQALGRIFRSRDKIIIVVAAVFAALHYGSYGPLTVPFIFIVALTLSLVSLRDGRLELVIGAHTMQNWLSIGSVVQMTSGRPTMEITWTAVVGAAAYGLVFYVASGWLVRRFCDNRPKPAHG